MKKIEVGERLKKLEEKFRMLPPDSGARYTPLWGLCKTAVDAGYDSFDVLQHYINGIYLSQWGKLEPYIDSTVKHALEDTGSSKEDAVKIVKSKALDSVRKKYAEFTPEFSKWVEDNVLKQSVFPEDDFDENDLENLSNEAMRKIAGDIGEGQFIYTGTGNSDLRGVEGADSKVGFWKTYSAPVDALHNSWCPNMLDDRYRNKEHVSEIRFLAMEMDRELVKSSLDGKARMDFVYETQQKYWKYILSKKCLSVASLVFSGGKSIHALIPVTCTKEEFLEKQAKIKACYLKLYLDESMVDAVKKTRRPWGVRKMYFGNCGGRETIIDAVKLASSSKEEQEDAVRKHSLDLKKPAYIVQELLYLDESAKPMTIDEFIEGMQKIYSEYSEEKNEVDDAVTALSEPMPLAWKETEDAAGEKKGKWVWNSQAVDDFIRSVGIYKINPTPKSVGLIQKNNQTNVIREMCIQEAWDAVYDFVKDRSKSMASELRDKYSGKFTNSGLEVYTGNHLKRINKLMGSKKETYFPYRNGLLVVKPDSVELKPYSEELYHGEIWSDAPTLEREWSGEEYSGSEFETFIRHLCGSELENKELAEKRFNAICSVLGYEISAVKEFVNWAIFITDESLNKSDGGTGKSLAMKSIQFMRKMWVRDNAGSGSEFDWSNVTRSIYCVGIDECDEKFNFRDFFSKTTGSWNVSHKFVDGVDVIPESETPSLIFCTNFIPRGMERSYERRKKLYEVSMYYQSITPYSEFGHSLFFGWDQEEWKRFDKFMVKCSQLYLKNGLADPDKGNINATVKTLLANVPEEVVEWLEAEIMLKCNEGRVYKSSEMTVRFADWCVSRRISVRSYSIQTINKFIVCYCNAKGITDVFKKRKIIECENGVTSRKVCRSHVFTFPKGWEDDCEAIDSHSILQNGDQSNDQSNDVDSDGYPF